jgi:hypothetical protein
VVDLQTAKHLSTDGTARALRIGVYEPLAFFNNPNVGPMAESTSTRSGGFTFTVPVPDSRALVVTTRDPSGEPPPSPLTIGASGLTVVAGQQYRVDGYIVEKSLVDDWYGVDPAFATDGSVVACFYDVQPGAPTDLLFDETMPPTSGVQVVATGMTSLVLGYLKPDATVDSALTSTGSRGCAVVAGEPSYAFQGGGVTQWEKKWSGATTGVVFVQAIKSCDNAPAGTQFCN